MSQRTSRRPTAIRVLLAVVSCAAIGFAGCSSSETGLGNAGATGGPAPGCHGDEAAWAAAIKPIMCSKNSDCCVIINPDTHAAQVVFSENRDDGRAAWPYCDKDANNCAPPAVDVYCVDSACVGYVHEGFTKNDDHCGFDGADDPTFAGGDNAFTCGG